MRKFLTVANSGWVFTALLLSLFAGEGRAQELIAQDRRAFADGLMSRGLVQLALPEYRALAADASVAERDVILFRLAECERQAGNLSASEKACAELLAKYPQSKMCARARLTRGLILMETGKAAEAASLLDELATNPNEDAELTATALYHAAEAREKTGDSRKAESRYNELVKRAGLPGVSSSVAELGAYAALRIAAIKAFDNTPESYADAHRRYADIAARPFSPRVGAEALFQSAALSYRLGKYDDAVVRYRELAAKYPEDVRVADSLLPGAWANYRAGRYADALTAAGKIAASAGPQQLEAAYLKANALAQLAQRKEAIAAYDALLSLPASSADAKELQRSAKYERLVVLFKNGDFGKVLADAALFTDPPAEILQDFIWLQAQSAEALKDDARAVQFYRMLIAKCPDCALAPDATYRLAYRLQQQETWLEASRTYLSLAAAFPENPLVPQALFSSGFCLARAGKSSEALRDWKSLIEKHPGDAVIPEALFQKAMEEIRGGLSRDAAASLDSLLARPDKNTLPRYREALFWRARISYDEKEYAAAEKSLRDCLAGTTSDEIRHEAEFLLGLSLQAQGRDAEAATCFQPLLTGTTREKFTEDRLAWLSEFQFSRKDYASARDAAKELAARGTTADWIQAGNTLAGRAYVALADTNNAIASYRLAADSAARTKYAAESALRLGELLTATGDATALAEATDYLSAAIQKASSRELVAIRANAYFALAVCTEKRGDRIAAARYFMAVSLLFNDPELVPAALSRAAAIYRGLGMTREAEAAEAELKARVKEAK